MAPAYRMGSLLATWLIACDREPAPVDARPAATPEPQAVAPEPAAPVPPATTTVEPKPVEPPPAAESAPLAATDPRPPLPDVVVPSLEGLPAFTEGKPIRLASLPVSERKKDGAKLPSVALTDPASRAALDAAIERAQLGRCKVLLAIETAVSMRCTYTDDMTEQPTQDAAHFRIGAGGEVESVDGWSFLHPGLSSQNFIKLLLHNPGADDRVATFTSTGLELTRPWGSPDETSRLPWRAIAPYVRADGALASALVAEGLTLAPVGTQMNELPEPTAAIWTSDAAEALTLWLRLPADLQAKARLVTPGGPDPAGLVFAPDVESSDLLPFSRRVGEGFFVEPMTKLVLARAKEPVVTRIDPGSATDVVGVRPAGTVFVAAVGTVDRTQSGIDAKRWSFVNGGAFGGWVGGRSLEPAERCIEPAASRDGMSLALFGTAEITRGGTPEAVAWLVYEGPSGSGVQIDVHPRAGCTLGPRMRNFAVPLGLGGLYFAETTKGGDTLVVVHAVGSMYNSLGQLLVYGLGGDAPIYRKDRFAGTVELGVTKGPAGEAGWFPVVLTLGASRTWLTWNGTTLDERAP